MLQSPRVRRRWETTSEDGFGLVEVLVVIAILAILVLAGFPTLATFRESQRLRGGAQELVTVLGRARQLSIATNTSYRVDVDLAAGQFRFVSTPANVIWTGPGTDSGGNWRLQNDVQVTGVTANPVFTPMGTATGGTITVRTATGTTTSNVVVNAAGRIRIQ